MKFTPLLSLLLALSLWTCTADAPLLSYQKVKTIFGEQKTDFKQISDYLAQSSQGFDFASFTPSNDSILLTLGKEGIQHRKTIDNQNITKQVKQLIADKHYSILKQDQVIYFLLKGTKNKGKESAAGILKTLTADKPKMHFPWIENAQIESLEGEWFYFSY